MAEEDPKEPPENRRKNVHSAQDVRQGQIILRTPLLRWIFFGALIGFVVLALVLSVAAYA